MQEVRAVLTMPAQGNEAGRKHMTHEQRVEEENYTFPKGERKSEHKHEQHSRNARVSATSSWACTCKSGVCVFYEFRMWLLLRRRNS